MTAPLGVVVTARTVAPGRGPPTAALAASAGSADQSFSRRVRRRAMRITGWFTPSGVGVITFWVATPSSPGAVTAAAAPIVQLDRQHLFERRADHAALLERSAAEDEQAAAADADEFRGQRRAARA